MSAEKRILVTGSTRGLGLAIVTRLATEGYSVIATGRRMTGELERAISTNAPERIRFEPFDFSQTSDIHGFVKTATSSKGIYGLVNNAAVGHDGVLGTMHDSQIEELIQVNVLAPILLTKYVSRAMLANGEGRIVNITSIIANTGFSGLSVYGASKAALGGFTKSLARELGKQNITVNTIVPGFMRTDMTKTLEGEKLMTIERRSPLGRLAETSDVASSVAFLLGPGGASITGSAIVVDAGATA